MTFISNLKRFSYYVTVAVTVAVGLVAVATTAQAKYPEKPITLVIGFSAGGGVDSFARAFAANAKEVLGVPLAVVNKAGAASSIAARQVKKARPDGYTLFVTTASSLSSKIMLLGEKAGLDLNTDFITLGSMGQLVTGLLVPIDSPFKTAGDLVAYVKKNPGELRWSHPGRGSLHMIAGTIFLADNGIKVQDVPFKGGGKARNAIAGSQVDFGFMGVQLVSGFEEKVRAVGVTSAQRDSLFKTVPTFSEQGLPQMKLSSPIVLYAPAGIDPKVQATLVKAIVNITKSDGFLKLAAKAGLSAGYLSPQETKNLVDSVSTTVRPVIAKLSAKK